MLALPQGDWRRPPGRPRITWLSTIQHDLRSHSLTLREAVDIDQSCPLWRLLSMSGATQSWVACEKLWRRVSRTGAWQMGVTCGTCGFVLFLDPFLGTLLYTPCPSMLDPIDAYTWPLPVTTLIKGTRFKSKNHKNTVNNVKSTLKYESCILCVWDLKYCKL